MCYFCLDSASSVNTAVSGWMMNLHFSALTEFMFFVTDLGSPQSMTLIAATALLFFALGRKYRHMIQFVITLSACALAIWVVKNAVQLPRPATTLFSEKGYSFISGHAAFASTFIILLLHAYSPHVSSRWLRLTLCVLGAIAALLIGISRLYLGVHYATDVIGGFVLGSVIAFISVYLFGRYSAQKRV